MDDEQQEEQLDFGDEGEDDMGVGVEDNLDEEEEEDAGQQQHEGKAGCFEEGHYSDQAEVDDLAGLGDDDDDMHEEQAAAATNDGRDQHHQQQQQAQQHATGDQDGSTQQKEGKGGKKIIDLTKSSNRLERVQAPRGQQKQQEQQQQQQPQQPQQQEQRVKDAASNRPASSSVNKARSNAGSNSLRGPLRYFMLKSVNEDNWALAQQEGCWATQQHNENMLNAAFRNGQEVVLFMSINKSGAIQGYGRMISLSGQGPQNVPWLDIDADKVRNFSVSWDCTVPLPFEVVKDLQNPWSDPKLGARSVGPPLGLNRHRDGQELAPQVGERLLEAMNRKAASANKPAKGPLAQGVGRGAPSGPAAGWPQRQMPPAQLHMQQQQQRLMMMQQQQQRGMGPGRGMMGPGGHMMGPGVPGAMGPNRPTPGRGMQQPPPPNRQQGGMGPLRPGAGPGGMGPIGNDPRLNPRFAGRLKMDGLDDLPPSNGTSRGRSPPPYSRSTDRDREDWERDRRPDSRSRRYEAEHERDWPRAAEQHQSRGRQYSRSRSRSPARSRGASNGRVGGAESSWGVGDDSPNQQRQQEEEPESMQDMSYEQYLATWDRVQQRKKMVPDSSQQQQQQQSAGMLQQQQQPQPQRMAGRAAGSVIRGTSGVGGMMGVDGGGGGVGGRMMRAAGPGQGPDGLMRPGIAAGGGGADGAQGPGRAGDNPQIPSLAQYMQRIKARMAERGQPLPPDDVIKAKYQQKIAQMQQGQQMQRMQPQQQQQQGMASMAGAGGPGMMGMGPAAGPAAVGMTAMSAMNPMMAMNMNPMMAAAAMATNVMGMMASGAGGMMGPMMGQGPASGMMGPGPAGGMQMQPGMMGPAGGMMGRTGGGMQGGPAASGRGRGGRGQMMPMQAGGF